MALSGTLSKVVATYFRLQIDWTATQDIASNTSTVTAKMYLISTTAVSNINSTASKTLHITIDGTTYTHNVTIGLTGNQTKLLGTSSKTIAHSADGTKSFGISGDLFFGITFGSGYVGTVYIGNQNYSLNTIARTSTPTLSASSTAIGSAVTINTNRASTNFTHTITYAFGSASGTIATGVETSYAWTLPASLANQIPNATSGVGTIYLYTYSGSTHIGTKTIGFTATIPNTTAFQPSISNLASAIAGSGRDKAISKYVQGISKASVSFSSSANGGATITNNNINIKRKSDGFNSMNVSGKSGTSGVIVLSGVYILTATTTDSRNRSKSTTLEITVDAYAVPKITSFTARRQNTTRTKVDTIRSGVYTYMSGNNPLVVTITRRPRGGSYTTLNTTAGTTTGTFTGTYISTDNAETTSYDFKLTISDSFGNSAIAEIAVPTSSVALSINGDIGIGVGKIHEQGALDVGGDVYVTGNIVVNGTVSSSGDDDDPVTTKPVKADLVWEYKMAGEEPVFSTPIMTTFSNGRKVVIYQSWDWFIYVQDIMTGELIWRHPFAGQNYGRPQAEDVNGDGKIEIIGASHDGKIYCLGEEGQMLWIQNNLYAREGTGTVTSASAWGMTDSSKNWVTNAFTHMDSAFNATLSITSGTGAGQVIGISDVDPNTIWLTDAFTTVPDSTSTYEIVPKYESNVFYQHAGTLIKEGSVWYLYITGFDNQCVKYRASNGQLIWQYSALENNEPFPVVTDIDGDGNLECIFASIDQNIHCLNASNGTIKWKTHLNTGIDCFGSYDDVDEDGVVEYITNSRGGRTYYLDGVDGSIKYKSTDWSVWSTSEANSRPTAFDYKGQHAVVFGGLAGWLYCLDGEANTIWRKWNGSIMRGSTVVHDVNGDGKLEIVVPDMMGTVKILNIDGDEIGQLNIKGGVEGTPLVGDFDGDGNVEIVITSLDGYVKMFRFLRS